VNALLNLVDSHCHLDLEQFDSDRDDVVATARAAGVRAIVNPGIDLASCQRAIALSQRHPEVHCAVGIHPNSSDGFEHDSPAKLRDLAGQPKVVAIGEIGLDYYWDRVEHAQQQTVFEQQLDLAAELGLPVIIHCRDANNDVMATLRTWVHGDAFRRSALADRPFAGVLHAFPGDLAMAEEAYTWNFVISLGGPVTFKNARSLHTLAPMLRLDRLMLETDAPYLTPHPRRGQRNEPAYVALICQQLAHLYAISPGEVAQTTTAVAVQFFQLEDTLGGHSPSCDAAIEAGTD